ncbi:unnamed protein product [Camellia sinensis]
MARIIGSVGDDEALLGVALVEPRQGGTWEGSSCWAVTLQDIGVYHRDAVYQTKSPRHAHMRFSGTWPSVREQHNAGYKHKANVRTYYQQFEAQQNQSLIHQKIKEHLGQTTAYQQVGAAYNALRSRVPILPTPMMPMAGNTQLPVNSPLIPGARPPVLPRPLPGCCSSGQSGRKEEILKCGKGSNDLERIERGASYMSAPVMPPMVGPPAAAAALPGQITNLPRPPPMGAPSAVPGTTMTPASVSTSMVTPAMYQAANSTSGGFDSFNMSAQAPEADH